MQIAPSDSPCLHSFTCQNGLKAFIHDHSRPIPGGRWQIEVRLEVSVPVREEYFNGCANPREAHLAFVAEFGHAVTFVQPKVRNFISVEMREELTLAMTRELTESVMAYLGKPDFPCKFIMNRYRAWKEKEEWQTAHEKLMGQEGKMEREP